MAKITENDIELYAIEELENLLDEIERRLKQEVNTTELFTIKWKII